MIKDAELLEYHTSLEAIYAKVLDDVRWQLEKWIEGDAGEVERLYRSSRITVRVKSYDSILRKLRRENVESINALPDAIEDLLGIRIAAPTKKQARALFERFQRAASDWFCESTDLPKLVPYTIEDKNNYSLRTGYQAFHVTFTHDRSYAPATTVARWPVEIQIMSQLWEFWANYSRSYFYTGTGTPASDLLPYNAAISKILDSADELMIATADLLESERNIVAEQSTSEPTQIEPDIPAVRAWLETNVREVFGQNVKMPNELFVSKIADDLALYQVTLNELHGYFTDSTVRKTYEAILRASQLSYLPPYQQILCMILLGRGWSSERVVSRVNEALWPQGVRLVHPDAAGGPINEES